MKGKRQKGREGGRFRAEKEEGRVRGKGRWGRGSGV